MNLTRWVFAGIALTSATALAKPKAAACPDAIRAAVAKAFPEGAITSCKAEREDGVDQFEAKVSQKDKTRVEIDVATDGTITQVEEKIAVDQVPAPVMKAFAVKYPKAKATRAEKQTRTGHGVFFELAFKGDHGRKEATFSDTGAFVEEE
jgi:hypothetical protein